MIIVAWEVAMTRRIVVVGNTGSGKTTFAAGLARRLGSTHLELDALFWGPNWTHVPADVFRSRVAAATAGESWVADGNYSAVRDLTWGRADTLVWLDYPLLLSMFRLIRRTFGRIRRREELWEGNHEDARMHLLSRDSLLLYAITSHRRRRRQYEHALAQPEVAHLHVLRFQSPRAAQDWLRSIANKVPGTST
jgi:adenylate kinase family enzyme